VALPTFVIGGAAKAGTTALWALLDAHPQVWMSQVKEPRFFTRNFNEPVPGVKLIGRGAEVTHERGLAWYESLFEGGADLPARGEASVQYLGAVDGPELMERYAPGLNVVFALRQPADRAYSHYWWHRKRGLRLPPFSAVLDDHPALRYLTYMSEYAQHLERYRRALGPDRVHLVLFDDLRSDPTAVYRELCRFIGVDDTFLPPSFGERYKRFGAPRVPWLQRGIWQTRDRGVGRFMPAALRPKLGKLRRSLHQWNIGRGRYPPLDPTLRARLTERFAPDIDYVERLTRHLPQWRAASSPGTAQRAEVTADQAS
jgi:hypothetical protein